MILLPGLLLPFAGTVLGAATVFLMHRSTDHTHNRHNHHSNSNNHNSSKLHSRCGLSALLHKSMTGFAAGVMTAAALWSLLIPAIEMSRRMSLPDWAVAAAGFVGGMAFLLLLDNVVPHLHIGSGRPEGIAAGLGRTTKLILAVTLHNIPEGMAVGVVLAGALSGSADITTAAALALSAGIALQNIPEGAIVSMPVMAAGNTRRRAFLYGVLSGVAELAAGIVTVLLADVMRPLLPWLLAFAAGAMLYVVVEELIPEGNSGRHSDMSTVGFAAGFVLMMILDVATG